MAGGKTFLVKTKTNNENIGKRAENIEHDERDQHIEDFKDLDNEIDNIDQPSMSVLADLFRHWKCPCGQPWRYTDEISGGREATPHEFPWVVRIVGGCAGLSVYTD